MKMPRTMLAHGRNRGAGRGDWKVGCEGSVGHVAHNVRAQCRARRHLLGEQQHLRDGPGEPRKCRVTKGRAFGLVGDMLGNCTLMAPMWATMCPENVETEHTLEHSREHSHINIAVCGYMRVRAGA